MNLVVGLDALLDADQLLALALRCLFGFEGFEQGCGRWLGRGLAVCDYKFLDKPKMLSWEG